MVVVLSPLIDFYSRLVQRSEPVRAQAFLAELAVEAFDERVLSRFFTLYKAKCRTTLFRPKQQVATSSYKNKRKSHLRRGSNFEGRVRRTEPYSKCSQSG